MLRTSAFAIVEPVVQTLAPLRLQPPPSSTIAPQAGTSALDAPVKIDVRDLTFYYGSRRALERIILRIRSNQVTALIGPSGCGKSTFLRTLNRMNDIVPGARVEGSVSIDGRDIYDPLGRRRGFATARRDGVPEVEPVSEVDLRQRRLRPAHQPAHPIARGTAGRVEASLVAAALWDEVKDRLHTSALASVRWPAAAPVHRARAGRRARDSADGRTGIGARSHRDAAHRGTDLPAQSPDTRSSSSRITCSRRHASPT